MQYATSRRAKQEQSRIFLQVFILIFLAVALIAGVFFVAIPAVIKFLAAKSGPVVMTTTDVPVQAPFLAAPVSATSSAALTVSGFAQPGQTVHVVNNSQPAGNAAAKDDGSFTISITLAQGTNLLSVYATDANNKQSPVSAEYHVRYSNQPPKLEIKQPQDKQTFQGKANQNLTIMGNTDAQVRVSVNGRMMFVKDDGSFSTTYLLSEGDTTLDIKAVDEASNTAEKTLTVTFHQ